MNIRPLPDKLGVGFQSVDQLEVTYNRRVESDGRVWRYFVTPEGWAWPERTKYREPFKIDAFAPNLNKKLHIGHLRQLALANCIKKSLPNAELVSMCGTTGLLKSAVDDLQAWFDFLNFHPKLHYDALMPQDADIVVRREGDGEHEGAMVWDGPLGPVVVMRKPDPADKTKYRRPTYAFHDLSFAATVKPDFYVTGVEQVDHFKTLGLQDKHLPMGLVLDAGGKKLKSRTGDAYTAEEAFDAVQAAMKPTPDPKKIVWNVIAWNMLSSGRQTNIKFEPERWVKPEAPGMYCSYTWARLHSALGPIGGSHGEMTQTDAELAGFASYIHYHQNRMQETMDPAPLANFLYDLCRRATKAYHTERIRDGRPGFRYAMGYVNQQIHNCMSGLGMFPIPMRDEDVQ